MKKRSASFYSDMKRRRTVRHFSDRVVQRVIIENCLRTAATAPSGANIQPWRFVVVTDGALKKKIREAAEKVEREFYSRNATRKWVEALKPLGTDQHKPFLEIAPYLIVIFAQRYGMFPDGICSQIADVEMLAVGGWQNLMGMWRFLPRSVRSAACVENAVNEYI